MRWSGPYSIFAIYALMATMVTGRHWVGFPVLFSRCYSVSPKRIVSAQEHSAAVVLCERRFPSRGFGKPLPRATGIACFCPALALASLDQIDARSSTILPSRLLVLPLRFRFSGSRPGRTYSLDF